jgi:cell division protein FtsQ
VEVDVTATARRRLLPRVRPRAMLRWLGLRGLGVLLAVAAVLVGAFFWVRQSSLVAVQDVTVTGVSGPDAAAIRSTLVRTAEGMTTMELDRRRLEAAVAPYPYVRSLRLSAHFPHALDIAVSERLPVAVVQAGGQRITVSSDGLLMPGTTPRSALPTIASATTPNGASVGGPVRKDVAVLAAAPYPLLAKVASAAELPGHGLAVTLRDGPVIYFGDDGRLAAKWKAAITVLASTTSNGADYIDVTDPARPAAGVGSDQG